MRRASIWFTLCFGGGNEPRVGVVWIAFGERRSPVWEQLTFSAGLAMFATPWRRDLWPTPTDREAPKAAQARVWWVVFISDPSDEAFSIETCGRCDYRRPYRRPVTSSEGSCRGRESAIFSFPPGMLLRSATAAWLSFPRATLLAAIRRSYHFLISPPSRCFLSSAPLRSSASGRRCESHDKAIHLKPRRTSASDCEPHLTCSDPLFLRSLWSTSFVCSSFVCVLLFYFCSGLQLFSGPPFSHKILFVGCSQGLCLPSEDGKDTSLCTGNREAIHFLPCVYSCLAIETIVGLSATVTGLALELWT